ncbi:MAG: SDR family oxidoreductase [Paramuribaculum sp.]|nr:SDR family oxidoreductase [Paramuribaculum sp.]
MADNWLERRMDDYRAGRLAATRHKQAKPAPPTASQAAPLAGSRIFIKCHSLTASPAATALLRLLASAGCKVAFTDTDAAAGNRLAQATGTQCHPVDIADEVALKRSLEIIARRWGGIDFTISPEDSRE